MIRIEEEIRVTINNKYEYNTLLKMLYDDGYHWSNNKHRNYEYHFKCIVIHSTLNGASNINKLLFHSETIRSSNVSLDAFTQHIYINDDLEKARKIIYHD